MSRAATRLVLVFAVLCGLVAASCSVSTNEEPVAAGDIFQDFVETTTTTTASTTPDAATKREDVYFLEAADNATRLREVERMFELDDDVQDVLASLFSVPPDTEGDERRKEQGLSSAIPEGAVLSSATVESPDSTELVVDVSGLFGSIQGSQMRNALAQIVLTATASEEVRSVSFTTDGEPSPPIIVGDGTTVERPVDRRDYESLL